MLAATIDSGSALGALQGRTGTAGNALAQLSSTDFMKLLVQELTQQDPFKPQDSSKILEQLSSLRTIESQTHLQDRLGDLVLQNQIAQASNLIGRMVEGLDAGNNRIVGMVTSVRVIDGRAILELDTGKQLPMDRLTSITAGDSMTVAG